MAKAVKVATSLTSTIELCDGTTMPAFGLGTYQNNGKACSEALAAGYRMLDTAQMYENEDQVGEAVRNSGLKREDVFVVSKVFWTNHGTEKARASIKKSLKDLDIVYVDLFLIHTPEPGQVIETYDELFRFKEEGLIKSVGVANFGIHHLEELRKAGRPTPSVNQFELHPWRERRELIEYCREHDIAVMGFSPLGRGEPLKDAKLKAIAKKYKKDPAQILVRWGVQKGFITIPKASTKQHIIEDTKVFDFSISDEDMGTLATFEYRTFWGAFQGVESAWKG